jgi:hypothetical protein
MEETKMDVALGTCGGEEKCLQVLVWKPEV